MRLTVVVDRRYWMTPDGAMWTRMPPDWRFFQRHTEVFDEVRVLARVVNVEEPPERAIRADGPGIMFLPIPNYEGPVQFAARAWQVWRSARRAFRGPEAVLLRVPSHLANCLSLRNACYGVEVLADPEELYASGTSGTPFCGVYRAWFRRNLLRQCREAIAVSYVSENLAAKYPAASRHILLDLELPGEAFGSTRRRPRKKEFDLVTAGGFDHPVKGHDVLIRAAAEANKRGVPLRLSIVGEGRLRKELHQLALQEGVDCRFVGQLDGASEVREALRAADVFALASRSEGKPRVLIEAMALGVPAVATAVGGIPEVLSAEQCVPRDDADALAAVITRTLRDGARYERVSEQGIAAARPFALSEQWSRRKEFLFALKDGCRAELLNRSVSRAKH